MKVDVLFFAQLRDAFGCDSKSVDVEVGATVADVVEILKGAPEWDWVARLPLTFAVNERVVDQSHELSDGERLALLTPISGG